MKHEIKKIQEKIKSNNRDILDQSRKIIDEFLIRETERGKSIVKRINILITLSGAISAVILFFGKIILDINNKNFLILIYFICFATILFLIKSIYFLIRSLRPTQMYVLSPELLIFDIQGKDYEKSLRYEITWKIWEYFQMQPVNTEKLIWLDRGQRNLLFSIISFLFWGLLLLINKNVSNFIPNWIEYTLGGIFILFAFFCDYILDKFGFWNSTEKKKKKG
ncbi:MAG: hypothetical protein KAT49_01275 [Methanomicrobia archaeon]|nr:hypothetical protein [Methanomicrobia archaeon]